MEAPQKDKWYFYNPITINTRTRIFGYRSAIFRLIIFVGICAALWWFFRDGFTLFAGIGVCAYFNIDVMDLKRITVNTDYIYATRYLKITTYDLRFWTRDVNAAIIWPARNCYKLQVMLKDGTEQKIDLLGMVAFERTMLQSALDKLDLPDQKKYRR